MLSVELEKLLGDESDDNANLPGVQQGYIKKIHCRLLNVEPVTPLKNLKANCYGKSCIRLIVNILLSAVGEVYVFICIRCHPII